MAAQPHRNPLETLRNCLKICYDSLKTLEAKGKFEFGRFVLDTEEHALRRDSELIPLPPKALDLLEALVTRHGRIVTKEELLRAVWPDTFVEENNLSVNISTLRKVLGGDGEAFIETIPRRGYRFVAPVVDSPDVAPNAPPVAR